MSMPSEGTALRRGDGAANEQFTLCGFVSSVSGFGGGSPTVNDVSTLQDSFRRKLLGLRDEGQAQMTLQWAGTDEEFQAIHEDRAEGRLVNWELEMPDGTEFDFAAYVLTFETVLETDTPVTVNVTLEIDGEIEATWPTES